jgi:ribosomal protein S18 acetylase RimI-like enzyme
LYEISEILTDSFPLTPPFMPWLNPLIRAGIHEDLRSRLRSTTPHYACLVAIDARPQRGEESLVGTVEIGLRTGNPWQPKTSQYVYLSNLAVRQSMRRQGIAQQLLLSCERRVADWGYRRVYLHVLETNEQAKQLYFKLGYEVEEIQPSWGSFLFGQPKRIFLRKELWS